MINIRVLHRKTIRPGLCGVEILCDIVPDLHPVQIAEQRDPRGMRQWRCGGGQQSDGDRALILDLQLTRPRTKIVHKAAVDFRRQLPPVSLVHQRDDGPPGRQPDLDLPVFEYVLVRDRHRGKGRFRPRLDLEYFISHRRNTFRPYSQILFPVKVDQLGRNRLTALHVQHLHRPGPAVGVICMIGPCPAQRVENKEPLIPSGVRDHPAQCRQGIFAQ